MENNIRELVEKFKKNSKLNLADQALFEKQLGILISQERYNNDIEIALCDGPRKNAMSVFARVVTYGSEEVATEILKKFLFCNRLKENKGGNSGIRMGSLIIALNSCDKRNEEILCRVFKQMIYFSYRKENGELNKKMIDFIRGEFLPNIFGREETLSLQWINKDSEWIKVRNLFGTAAFEESKVPMELRKKVFNWLSSTEREMGNYTIDLILSNIDTSKKNDVSKQKDKNFEQRAENKADNKETDVMEEINVQNCLKDLIKFSLTQSKSIEFILEEMQQINNNVSKNANLIAQYQQNKIEQDTLIQDLMERNENLSKKKKELEKEIENLNSYKSKLEQEIEERKQFTDTVIKNRENQSQEFINKLASKLKYEYRDFLDARELEMSVDLGENMRLQLESVFSILNKNGVNIK